MAQHSLPPPLSQAFARLRANLSGLESAAERSLRHHAQQGSQATELALMQDDRARLASELDTAIARADRLAKSAKEVDKRLNSIGRSLKKILGEDPGITDLGITDLTAALADPDTDPSTSSDPNHAHPHPPEPEER